MRFRFVGVTYFSPSSYIQIIFKSLSDEYVKFTINKEGIFFHLYDYESGLGSMDTYLTTEEIVKILLEG